MVSYFRGGRSRRRLAIAGACAGAIAAMSIVFADPISPITLTKVDSRIPSRPARN